MKITFSNLGAIKKTTLDLRPLTVIIGPNNSNKTYIAYSIYGLFKFLGYTTRTSFIEKLGFNHYKDNKLENINKFYDIDDRGHFSLKINNEFFNLFTEDCWEGTRNFEKGLRVFFQDSSKKLFKETKFELEFSKNELIISLQKLLTDLNERFQNSFQFFFDGNVFRVEYKKNEIFGKEMVPRIASVGVGFEVKELLFSNPFLLPAERNALIVTYKVLEAKRYELLKDADRESIEQSSFPKEFNSLRQRNIRYPQPIEDFLKFLTNLELENTLDKGNFANLADDIEMNLQQKNKTNYVSTEVGGKEIKINVKKGLDIDLYNASSSIKQLAPLLLYLRYRAKENDLLIIDEPEMNLHPKSQAKLLEVLGMLVNAGVNVLLTTHSPYFMSHLNNLISGDMSDEKIREKQAKSLYLEDARAFLSPDDVSAYEMKKDRLGNQKLRDLKDKDKDYGIRWDTLSDVSADIQQKFFEIYEKAKGTSNGRKK